jgi:hypothetical protein
MTVFYSGILTSSKLTNNKRRNRFVLIVEIKSKVSILALVTEPYENQI